LRTFAAGARQQNVNGESRHSNNCESRVLSAPPQGGSEPKQSFCCYAADVCFPNVHASWFAALSLCTRKNNPS
jgi:hypothetical protein